MDEENKRNEIEQNAEFQDETKNSEITSIKTISGMYKNWFLDYASYVILERAVPHLSDGLKPVQRRILHAMKRLDDGRYNKVANIIGYTMQYHPHGDASIGDALVQLGQKDLLIDTQGNWGNVLTGDGAAAARYIEARLSKFALEVTFNPKTTSWKQSYDGRNKEPINLPVKFPLLLAQGVEGIAVGLASKILPHNFNELIDASIKYLNNQPFEIYPDFFTGGSIDVSKYNDGLRGGKVRIRAKIEKLEKKILAITEIPFSQTTGTLIESIIAANDKGKIKIKKIEDKTAANVLILIHINGDVSVDVTIDALYAFTNCEVSISPNSCVIDVDKPKFMGVTEILKTSVDNTLQLLKLELEIRKSELEDDWHNSSLEKIFIENRIYLLIEECTTWEAVIEAIDKGLNPFKPSLRREVTHDDIVNLTEIKIKRISKYDAFQADEHIKSVEEEMKKIKHHLKHLVEYTIKYYENIKEKFGKGKERKTEIKSFDTIVAAEVVVANAKLYVNWQEGFAGIGLKKDEFLCDCSDLDDIIVFRRDGTYVITRVTEKLFIGTNAIHLAIFRKNDERTIYNLIYRDGKSTYAYVKRFNVTNITRDREYNMTLGNPNSQVLFFSANPNGEAETVRIMLRPRPKLRRRVIDFDFSTIAIKGRNAQGNILTKNAIHKIILLEKGESTLGGINIWFDFDVYKLNTEGRGKFLGEFYDDEKVLIIMQDGTYRTTTVDLTHHFEKNIIHVEKFANNKVFTAIFFDGELKLLYMKRFPFEASEKTQSFLTEHPDSKLVAFSEDYYSRIEIKFGGKYNQRPIEIIDAEKFIGVKSFKARGKRLSNYTIEEVRFIEPLIQEKNEEDNFEINDPEFEIIRPTEE